MAQMARAALLRCAHTAEAPNGYGGVCRESPPVRMVIYDAVIPIGPLSGWSVVGNNPMDA